MRCAGCVPRIRGDDPTTQRKPSYHSLCSPHTRG
nr:MAG TPA: LASP-1 DOMAIN, ZINC-FINGER, METAL-BINDING PROTEIN [Caudoviricetes sp.]